MHDKLQGAATLAADPFEKPYLKSVASGKRKLTNSPNLDRR
jgi:hypothetical protein